MAGGFHPDDVERAFALALALNGRHAESERVLTESGIADNNDTEVIRGLLMLQQSSYAAAEEILRPVAEARSNEAKILNIFAATLYNQTRFEEAVTYLEGADELDRSIEGIAANLSVAKAARTAELLAENAATVKAAPTK